MDFIYWRMDLELLLSGKTLKSIKNHPNHL